MSTAVQMSEPLGARNPFGEPPPAVHVMDNHDRAYHLWSEAGFRNRVLVHVDAHHDMWWTDDRRSLSIANYICPALREKIVRRVYWVVPDATFRTRTGRAALRRHLTEIQRRYPGAPAAVHWRERSVRTAILQRPLIVCSLDALPASNEPVLLDVDTDYFVIPCVSYGEPDRHETLPWRWPDELLALLRAKDVRTDFVTIAYSVEGGHTPIQWKYLGDELAGRIQGGSERYEEAFQSLREGAEAQHRGDRPSAARAFKRAGERAGAAPFFWLAHMVVEEGRLAEARAWYQRALKADPSYRTSYASPGVPLFLAGFFEAAEAAFERTHLLDDQDPYPAIGLGWLAARTGKWFDVEQRARCALSADPALVDAHRLLGRALEEQRRLPEAIEAYETAVKLALAGRTGWNGVVASDPAGDRLFDGDHSRAHARLARLYARTGDWQRAAAGYYIAIAGGCDRPAVRFGLARLYLQQRRWIDACRQGWAGLRKAIWGSRSTSAAWSSLTTSRGSRWSFARVAVCGCRICSRRSSWR